MEHSRKVFLVGLPGSGKTTLAKEVSEHLGIPCFDLDDEIEKSTGIKVGDLFKSGEPEFRKIETETLKKVIGENNQFIMATGGGAPCFNDNLVLMKQAGITIFLDVPVDEICSRISSQSINRPLLKGDLKEKITTLWEQRIFIYRQAHHILTGRYISGNDITSLMDL